LDLGQELVDRIGSYIAHEPPELTVTHGDMRLDNILFHADGRIAALVDWQTCSLGNPANDVAYLIGTSFADPEERRKQEEKLVKTYLSNRPNAPAFEIFWDEYRRHAFSGFLMAINASLHVEQTERGDRMFAAMAERPAQMAIDLDSLGLL
ncbi:MAG: phosphotransferase, partial [Parasphingorhabdus sp.]